MCINHSDMNELYNLSWYTPQASLYRWRQLFCLFIFKPLFSVSSKCSYRQWSVTSWISFLWCLSVISKHLMKKLAYTLSKNAITINAVFNSEEEQGLKNLIFFSYTPLLESTCIHELSCFVCTIVATWCNYQKEILLTI